MSDKEFLQLAIEKSIESVKAGAYPVGAVIVQDGKVISAEISNGKQLMDPTSHAEIAAIRDACQKLKRRDIGDVVLYTSLEPCVMCYSAIFWAYIPKVVYACSRGRVAIKNYEGKHDIHVLNESARRQVNLVQMVELEEKALNVINNWEIIRKT